MTLLPLLFAPSQPRTLKRLFQLLAASLGLALSYVLLLAVYDFYVEHSPPREIGPSIKYVSLCSDRLNGDHRTGNHLFMLAAMLYVAKLTNRRIAMPRTGWDLDSAFSVDVTRIEGGWRDLCPCRILQTSAYDFDESFADQAILDSLRTTKRTLLLCGLSQSWRYPAAVDAELRRSLQFIPDARAEADRFHRDIVGAGDSVARPSERIFRVGVHVRRGDFQAENHSEYGLTVVNAAYLKHAFEHFERRYDGRVRFVVTSNDFQWTLDNLPSGSDVVIANHTGPVDLAILAACDAVIISTGSFGWWAAWLGNVSAVYYAVWPRPGSTFDRLFNRTNYFPPYWEPML